MHLSAWVAKNPHSRVAILWILISALGTFISVSYNMSSSSTRDDATGRHQIMSSNHSSMEEINLGVSETAHSVRQNEDYLVLDIRLPEQDIEATRHRRVKKKSTGNMGMSSSKGKKGKSPKKAKNKGMMSPKRMHPITRPPTSGVVDSSEVVQAVFGISCGGGRAPNGRTRKSSKSRSQHRRQLRTQILYCTFEGLETGLLKPQFHDLRCPGVASITSEEGSVAVVETNLNNPQCRDRHLKERGPSQSERSTGRSRPQRDQGKRGMSKSGKRGKDTLKRKEHHQQEDIEPTPNAAICPSQGLSLEPLDEEEASFRRNLQSGLPNIFNEDSLECLTLSFAPEMDIADLGITGLASWHREVVQVNTRQLCPPLVVKVCSTSHLRLYEPYSLRTKMRARSYKFRVLVIY
jgi:hypothetical protein